MGTTTRSLRLALTAGDPFGVGPELCVAAWRAREGDDRVALTVYGDPRLLPGVPAEAIVAIPCEGEAPEPRGPSAEGGRASMAALERALEDLRDGRQDALVTAPISKASWGLAGSAVDGHTPLLGRFFGAQPQMAFVWADDEPVVALLTVHVPLRAVPSNLTSDRVEAAVRLLHRELEGRFLRRDPRIGVLGVNPHAGEGGLLGTEEQDFLVPALRRLEADGLRVAGPLPGDTAFAIRDRFDALLAIYHDQGLAPVKALAFREAVNVTLGLPVVRTSPAHGTAFDLAGIGAADPTSMLAAVDWAERLARARVD